MNAQVSFLDGEFSLIHIPIDLFPQLLQPILRVLLPQTESSSDDCEDGRYGLTNDRKHELLNISITPMECSIVCHHSWVERVFQAAINSLPKEKQKGVSVSPHLYVALSVISAGIDAGSRVVDLTSPLALAGIPIFFITTYFCDFILVPERNRNSVIQAFSSRGFVFSESEAAFTSPVMMASARGGGHGSAPSTPSSGTIADLQARTFELLKKHRVVPKLEDDMHLVHCSGRELHHVGGEISSSRPSLSRTHTGNGYHRRPTWVDNVDARLFTCLVSAMVSNPQFLSITLALDDPPSLLLDRELLPIFGESIVGDTETDLIPIFLDLEELSTEATGIVSGVAGSLVQEIQLAETLELLYLSTARAGTVILSQDRVRAALNVLQPLLDKV